MLHKIFCTILVFFMFGCMEAPIFSDDTSSVSDKDSGYKDTSSASTGEAHAAPLAPAGDLVGEASPMSSSPLHTDKPGSSNQSGVLTAGYIDDNVNFEQFLQFKAEFLAQHHNYPDIQVTVAAKELSPQASTELDVAFVIDATGSMSDELEYLKKEIDSIVNQVQSEHKEINLRYALIVYRDEGDAYVTRVINFTSDLLAFKKDLAEQDANGGGDYPEAMDLAMADANQLAWGDSSRRMLFLIADAPAHDEKTNNYLNHVKSLAENEVHIYPVAASGVADEAEYLMRIAGQLTKGRYIFLTDDSGIGNPHAMPHIPCYSVQLLKNVMIQMISSEIMGTFQKDVPANILRTVGNKDESGKCMMENQPINPNAIRGRKNCGMPQRKSFSRL